jgi:hypothetical protein
MKEIHENFVIGFNDRVDTVIYNKATELLQNLRNWMGNSNIGDDVSITIRIVRTE